MKSFADFRRRLAPGVELDAINHKIPVATGRRRIDKVQTNGFWFIQLDGQAGDPAKGLQSRVGKRCWTDFPMARYVRINSPHAVTFLDEDGSERVTLAFPAADQK